MEAPWVLSRSWETFIHSPEPPMTHHWTGQVLGKNLPAFPTTVSRTLPGDLHPHHVKQESNSQILPEFLTHNCELKWWLFGDSMSCSNR